MRQLQTHKTILLKSTPKKRFHQKWVISIFFWVYLERKRFISQDYGKKEMKMDIKEIIKDFLNKGLPQKLETSNNEDPDIYNEFSLQHELGIYLREHLGENYKVQFERNAKKLWGKLKNEDWQKTEIDIFVYKKNDQKKSSRYR